MALSFFFNDTATTEIYTLSLHDALPISPPGGSHSAGTTLATTSCCPCPCCLARRASRSAKAPRGPTDRKSTRLNSSHANISYAVFCLKKKKRNTTDIHIHTHKVI